MPDFDIDFCQNRRDEVIRYVQEKYGARPGRADHHLRHAAGARGAARRRPRAADALRPGRPAVQAGAAEPGEPGDALAKAIADEPRLAGGARRASRWSPALLAIAQKLEGLYRHASTHAAGIVIGDRPLDRAGAALPRPALRHAGHPVQHEVGGAGGPGQVRLPRPEDADRARDRGQARRRARHRDRSHPHPARRRQDLREPAPAAKRSACSRWKVRACGVPWSTCGRTASRT